ncbi:MAG: PRTRC system ParB family protein [Sulfuritalea sp.]|nr:PRTRC system ParB family protein [Sulfuritalea sp.]
MQLQASIKVGNILPGRNPRGYFDPSEMTELEESVKSKGVLQAILVRPRDAGRFEIVAGERRWRAAKKVFGDEYEIPALVRELDDGEADEAALIENIQRANMSPTEEAEAAAKILGRCQGDRDEASRRLGWSRTTLDKRLALMNCSEKVRRALSERRIQLGHAELLAAVTRDRQDAVLEKLLTQTSLPTVIQFRGQLEQISRALGSAIFDKGECAGCPHNSGNQQALFGEAIATGHCTHGACFDAKAEAALDAKKASLSDDYPTIRIVRAGENFTLLRLVAEGDTGVGDDQAKACRACKNFGAAISAVPGKLGNVYPDLCFDASCNAKKVAARIKAEKAKDAPAASSSKGVAGKAASASKSSIKSDAKAEAKVQDSQRVKDYRLEVWRKALRRELMMNRESNLTVLIALSLSGNARHIGDTKLTKALSALVKQEYASFTFKTDEAARVIAQSDESVREKMFLGLAASAADGIEEKTLVQLLKYLDIDLARHWKLCEDFLKLLTKSEIEAMCDEIGLKTSMGAAFAKAMNGKKDEIIKSLLNVASFPYEGKVPRSMRFSGE